MVLLRARDRALPAADPTGRDVRVSLGAAWEAMAIALSRHGLAFGAAAPPRHDGPDGTPGDDGPEGSSGDDGPGGFPGAGGLDAVMAAPIVPRQAAGSSPDPLAAHVEARRSFRGRFAATPPGTVAALRDLAARSDDLWLAGSDAGTLAALARLYDRAAFGFLRDDAYHEELWSWMRLTPDHPGWDRDGLNADCLALASTDRWAARLLFRPGAFRLLKRLPLARALVSEAPQIRSAAALILFAPDPALDDLAIGRRFYRLWLEITALGLAAAPMSALADDETAADGLKRAHRVPPERRLVNVFRVGTSPEPGAARSPRLPVDELVV